MGGGFSSVGHSVISAAILSYDVDNNISGIKNNL